MPKELYLYSILIKIIYYLGIFKVYYLISKISISNISMESTEPEEQK